MNMINFLHLPRVLCFLFIVTLLGACAAHREFELKFQPDFYQKLDKYPIRIHLELSEDYRKAVCCEDYDIPLGTDLTRYSTILAEHMFDLVSGSTSTDNESNIDAVLIPEILSLDHLKVNRLGSESKLAITQKWTLQDSVGKPIWIQAITGVGVMETGYSAKKLLKERILLAIDDLFIKSAKEISSSVEIRKFSEKVALERK